MKETINFDSHIPYYLQLIDILKEKVQLAEWIPGDQIPGEQDLCEQYQVSRTVVPSTDHWLLNSEFSPFKSPVSNLNTSFLFSAFFTPPILSPS